MQPTAFLVTVTDTQVTQYVLHADDPGHAIRVGAKQGIPVYADSNVAAHATPMSEEDYDKTVAERSIVAKIAGAISGRETKTRTVP